MSAREKPNCAHSRQDVARVFRWATWLWMVCSWGMAITVASLVLARADSFWVRASVLLVPFCLVGVARIPGVFIRLARPLRLAGLRVPLAMGVIVGIGLLLALLMGVWSGPIVLVFVLAGVGTVLSNPWLENQGWLSERTNGGNTGLGNLKSDFLSQWFVHPLVPAQHTKLELWRDKLCGGAFQPATRIRLTGYAVPSSGGDKRIAAGSRLRREGERRPRPDRYIVEFRNRAHQRIVFGEVRVCFSPQQQISSVHIPFWPPFEGVPGVRIWRRGKARVKVGRIYPFGMRLDVRLPSAAERDMEIFVRFRAIGGERGETPQSCLSEIYR